MYRLRFIVLSILIVTASAGLAEAQQTDDARPQIEEAPVRYDTDLLPASFHLERRQIVKDALPENAVAFFFSDPVRNRQHSVDYIYRQNSDLYYLTGTHEPESVLILAPGGLDVDGTSVTELLFVPPRDPHHETWEGRLFGAERAQEELGVEYAVEHTRYQEILRDVLSDDAFRVFYLNIPEGITIGSVLDRQVGFFLANTRRLPVEANGPDRQLISAIATVEDQEAFQRLQAYAANSLDPDSFDSELLREIINAFEAADDMAAWAEWRRQNLADVADGIMLRGLLNEMRTVKTGEELDLMRRTIDITVSAHREIMQSIEPGMAEYEISALAEYIFKRNGAQYTAFPSIVASGENSVILHYNTNRRTMEEGDIVVIDLGAEYHGYAADVTRTLPVNGTFSDEQRAIYQLVFDAQEAGIEAAQAGAAFNSPDRAARSIIADGLMELGLIENPQQAGRFFMHGTSHYLGLYVHDSMGSTILVPNSVITVEPGIYIAPAEDIDTRWWNIGVRIEDDILITEDGPVNLSAGAPREVDEIEALMRRPVDVVD